MVYFMLYIFIEVMVSSTISEQLGGFGTFFEFIGSAILGIFILQNFQFSLMEKINLVRNGELTQNEFVKSSIGAAIGAILLIVPGFFTDILGLLLQFSSFTIIFTKIFNLKNQQSMDNSKHTQSNFRYTNQTKKQGDDDVIDVEIIDDNKSIKY